MDDDVLIYMYTNMHTVYEILRTLGKNCIYLKLVEKQE